jgi:hypothetical protein
MVWVRLFADSDYKRQTMSTPSSSIGRGVMPKSPNQTPFQRILYGLPCAKCGTYYAADLQSCPICRCADRVPAVTHHKVR